MRTKQHIQVMREEYVSLTCDKCKKVVSHEDPFEFQEFFSYSTTGGFGSKYIGDMNDADIDLCQQCFYELLGPYIKITPL